MLLCVGRQKQLTKRLFASAICCAALSGCIESEEPDETNQKPQPSQPPANPVAELPDLPNFAVDNPPTAEPIELELPEPEFVPPKYDINISWKLPGLREDGEPLDEFQITGLEILYREINEVDFKSIRYDDVIPDRQEIPDLDEGFYEITIAVIDQYGQYSEYSEPMYVFLNKDLLN